MDNQRNRRQSGEPSWLSEIGRGDAPAPQDTASLRWMSEVGYAGKREDTMSPHRSPAMARNGGFTTGCPHKGSLAGRAGAVSVRPGTVSNPPALRAALTAQLKDVLAQEGIALGYGKLTTIVGKALAASDRTRDGGPRP
jgi:hypothetical protein